MFIFGMLGFSLLFFLVMVFWLLGGLTTSHDSFFFSSFGFGSAL
jgi:hypothetical protein